MSRKGLFTHIKIFFLFRGFLSTFWCSVSTKVNGNHSGEMAGREEQCFCWCPPTRPAITQYYNLHEQRKWRKKLDREKSGEETNGKKWWGGGIKIRWQGRLIKWTWDILHNITTPPPSPFFCKGFKFNILTLYWLI